MFLKLPIVQSSNLSRSKFVIFKLSTFSNLRASRISGSQPFEFLDRRGCNFPAFQITGFSNFQRFAFSTFQISSFSISNFRKIQLPSMSGGMGLQCLNNCLWKLHYSSGDQAESASRWINKSAAVSAVSSFLFFYFYSSPQFFRFRTFQFSNFIRFPTFQFLKFSKLLFLFLNFSDVQLSSLSGGMGVQCSKKRSL